MSAGHDNLKEDLKEVNAALRELVRLQLAGELSPQEAWQARRDMLDSVEMAWQGLGQDLTAEALASKQVLEAAPAKRWREWLTRPPRLQMTLRWQPVAKAFSHLPWWWLFLGAALLTFYYVSTL